MKRLLTLVLMAAAVIMAVPAFAAVQGSPHDYLNSTYGRCGICHVPHAAGGGKRLWRVAPSGTATGNWAGSNVGQLCYGCHGDGYLLGGAANINNTPVHAWSNAAGPFADSSHGRNASLLGAGTLGGTVDTSRPYMTGSMECTSCHNVHFEDTAGYSASNTHRPFLRNAQSTLSGYCATCHDNRSNNNTLGSLNTTGNHPVNIAYNGVNATLVPVASMPAALKTPITNNAWSLGGKFEGNLTGAPTSSNNIGCQTCHAVHSPAGGTDQGLHLLAVNNVADTAALCEGCHGNATGNAARPRSGATMRVGSVGNDHPIDCAVTTTDGGPTIDRWYMNAGDTTRAERHAANVFGTNANSWPRGATNGNIICTSCHSAHRARGGLKLTRAGWNNSGTVGWCNACHSDASPGGHHTHSGNTGSAFGNVASLLDCGSCHGTGISGGGSGSLAHNSFNFNSNFANNIVSNNASQLCNMCHLGITTSGGVIADSNTGNGGNDITGGIAVAALPADHLGAVVGGSASGNKSHWLGGFTDSVANSIRTKRNSWGAFGGFSKYGAATDTHGAVSDTTGTTLVCESCHSVLHNAGTATPTQTSGYSINLLLQNYQDDGHGTKTPTANTAVGSGLCIACHNRSDIGNSAATGVADTALAGTTNGDNTNVPQGTHPMSNWSITRAQDAARAPITLITADQGINPTYANATNAPNDGSYPDTDKMDCDSCHRPHYAPAASTYNQTKAGGTASRPVILEHQATANEWSDLCQQCHAM